MTLRTQRTGTRQLGRESASCGAIAVRVQNNAGAET